MMPFYSFENKKTKKTVTLEMKIAERDQYVKDNPHMVQVLTPPVIADSVRIGVTKPPADFQKYVLGRVKEVPGANKSTIEKRWQINKEV
jgi:hypothetical protein